MTGSKSEYRFSLIWVIYKAFMQYAEALRQQVKIPSFLLEKSENLIFLACPPPLRPDRVKGVL